VLPATNTSILVLQQSCFRDGYISKTSSSDKDSDIVAWLGFIGHCDRKHVQQVQTVQSRTHQTVACPLHSYIDRVNVPCHNLGWCLVLFSREAEDKTKMLASRLRWLRRMAHRRMCMQHKSLRSEHRTTVKTSPWQTFISHDSLAIVWHGCTARAVHPCHTITVTW